MGSFVRDCCIIVTIDSCRWDVFAQANLIQLKSQFNFKKCYTQATYTYPAHLSILQGILPNSLANFPYYNRFVRQLFRIEAPGLKKRESLITFDQGTPDLPKGFSDKGFKSLVVGAMSWFESDLLVGGFESKQLTGTNISRQTEVILQFLEEYKKDSKFILWNIGETHDPFEFGGQICEGSLMRTKLRNGDKFCQSEFDALFQKQKQCVEFIEEFILKVTSLINQLHSSPIIVICSDHGECFGENDLFGHGFYHKSVMEVPMAIKC